MKMDIKELETADFDILENIKMAFYRLWKTKMIVLIMTLISLMAFVVYVGIVGVHTTYTTTASIYSAVYGSAQESDYGVSIMNKYSGLVGTSRVCERAAGNLVGTNITAQTLQSMAASGMIYMSGASTDSKKYGYRLVLVVRSNSPENVIEIANAMAQAFVDEINDLMGSNGSLQVFDKAVSVSTTKSMNVKLFAAIFAAAAFVGTAGIIFVLEFFSSKVYSVAQCEMDKDLVLGVIPYQKK